MIPNMAKRRAPRPAQEAVSPDDAALFREAIGKVREFTPAAMPPRPRPPAPRPRQREADEADALAQSRRAPFALEDADRGEGLEYLRDGLSPRLLRRLKRGQFSVRDELDLHTMTAELAESAVRAFLNECKADERFCVRIVHGKGLRSGPEGPVLKGVVERMLRQRADVLAYASAPAAQGGTGAVLVLLTPTR